MINTPFLEPGKGVLLRQVAGSTGNVVSEDTSIPDGGYSETFAAHDCLEFLLLFEIAAAGPGGSVIVEQVLDQEASVAGETFDTVTVTAASRIARFNAGEALTGFFRVKNTAGVDLTSILQKRIN